MQRLLEGLMRVGGRSWPLWFVDLSCSEVKGAKEQLLDHEPRAAEQVPLLLQMKEEKIALVKAINSGDTDLGMSPQNHRQTWDNKLTCTVYQVLLHLRSSLSPGDFFHVLDDSISPNLTPAVKLLQAYAREGDRQLLRDFYYQDDRRTENACLEMEEAGTSAVCPPRLHSDSDPG